MDQTRNRPVRPSTSSVESGLSSEKSTPSVTSTLELLVEQNTSPVVETRKGALKRIAQGLRVAMFCFLLSWALIAIHYVSFLVRFLAHLPVYVPPVADQVAFTRAALAEGRPLVPLYVLSASDERWAEFNAPVGVNATRIRNTVEISDAYIARYIDPDFVVGPGNLKIKTERCATGHMYMWDLISRDARCARVNGGCLVMEDDAMVPNNTDPRPYMDTWKSLGPDFVNFYKHPWEPWSKFNNFRDTMLWLVGLPREDVAFVTFGWGTVMYMVTSEGADTLLEPFRSGAYRLPIDIDSYIFDQEVFYWHGLNTYVERRYPLIHNDHHKSLRASSVIPWS